MIADYGEWKSPISLDYVSKKDDEINNAVLDAITGKLFWRVKKSNGRYVVCSEENGHLFCEWTPEKFSVVSQVHEYGGGEFFAHNNELYFVNKTDQRLYKQSSAQDDPVPITEECNNGLLRYACGHINQFSNKIIMVREDHRIEDKECVNSIISIDLQNGYQTCLVEGDDFYKSVETHEERILFVSWNHPNMPWDITKLYIGQLAKDGKSVRSCSCVKTGSSVLQAKFINTDQYLYLSDEMGFWNVWKSTENNSPWYESSKESGWPFGWIFGCPGYGLLEKGIVIGAKDDLIEIDLNSPGTIKKDLGAVVRNCGYHFGTFANILCHNDYVYGVGLDDSAHTATLFRISLTDDSVFIYNNSGITEDLKPFISYPKAIEFPTSDTEVPVAYGFLYEPNNPDYTGNADEKPPLLVRIHGGPTGMTSRSLCMKIQYFTSRGFAVFDVDYRGSSGYGRTFRRSLYGKWGVYDIEDTISGVKHLIKEGFVDEKRLAINGGSAGGYTTMAMMVFKDFFHVGVSYFGLSNFINFSDITHKFESRYLDQLLGKLPEAEEIYRERSPLYHVEKLKLPIGFFQGSEDCICPPEQSKKFYDAALQNKVPTFYIEYEGESHGFRKGETIRSCISGEIYFLSKIFGFKLADKTENPPPILNLLCEDDIVN